MVAERAGVKIEQAFTALRTYARNHNRRLADVAEAAIGGWLAPSAFGSGLRAGAAGDNK